MVLVNKKNGRQKEKRTGKKTVKALVAILVKM